MANPYDQTYLKQWLATATKGNVTATHAWLADRVTYSCSVCDQSLTAKQPAFVNEMDYSVQEFVKIHSHTGGHESQVSKPPQELGAGWVSYKTQFGVSYKPTNTIDMKKIEASVIDDKPEKAKLIAEQMAKYDAEMTAKMTDQAIANKVKILQMQDAAKAKQEAEKIEAAYAEAMNAKEWGNYYSKDSVAKLKQQFQMFQYSPSGIVTTTGTYTGPQSVEASPPPKKKRDTPLKRIEGRKFR